MKSTIAKAGYKALRPKAADPLDQFLNDFALPPAENAARTQIAGTLPTYYKASDEFMRRGMQGRGLDYGAGLGKGAEVMPGKYETYEPFAKNWNPTYSKPQDIPSDAYNRLTNLNVLNVVPREVRDEIVTDIGRVMEPGGLGIITTRGADVMTAAGRRGPEPMSMITSRDTYQKGFRPDELQEYLRYMLGDRFEIDRLKLGPAGATIRKKAEGGLAELAGGGQSAKMLQQVYRGFAGKPGKEEIFASPQRRVADYYAAKRAAQTGEAPGVEALLVDPFAGKQYGHALPIDRFNKEFVTTQARKLSPLDVIDSRIIEKAKGGSTTPAWQRKEGQNPEGGLNAKGRASYKAETGGTLKRPQPEGGPRRDSFCARMKGMKKKLTSAKTANDPDSRINKSLRAWNCAEGGLIGLAKGKAVSEAIKNAKKVYHGGSWSGDTPFLGNAWFTKNLDDARQYSNPLGTDVQEAALNIKNPYILRPKEEPNEILKTLDRLKYDSLYDPSVGDWVVWDPAKIIHRGPVVK